MRGRLRVETSHRQPPLVAREDRGGGQGRRVEEAQRGGRRSEPQRRRRPPGTGEHEAPVAEARHVDVVGPRGPARGGHGALDRPERLRREVRRARLHHQAPSRCEHPAAHALVELLRVELGGGGVVGVGEVGDHDVEALAGRAQPGERVAPDGLHARIGQRSAIQRGEPLVVARQREHPPVELDQHGPAHIGVGEHLAQREPVAAAQDQHALVAARHRRVHERLVVAVLVLGGELQVPVDEQAQVAVARVPGQDDLLVARALEAHHRIVEQVLARGHLEPARGERGAAEHDEHAHGSQRQHGPPRSPEQRHHHEPGAGVERPDRQRGLDLPEPGQQQEREADPRDHRAQVVGRQQVGHRGARRPARARAGAARAAAGSRSPPAARSCSPRGSGSAGRGPPRRRRRRGRSPTGLRPAPPPPPPARTPRPGGAAAAWTRASPGPSPTRRRRARC